MKKYLLIIPFLALIALSSHAQKFRIKKEVLYVNDVAQYQFFKTSDKGLLVLKTWRIVSMQGDTLVWANGKEVSSPNIKHKEGGVNGFYWYELRFAGAEITTEYYYGESAAGWNLCKDLVLAGVLKDGSVQTDKVEAFREQNMPVRKALQEFQRMAAHREQLFKNSEYEAYAKGLERRSIKPNLGLIAGRVWVINVSGINDEIGSYQVSIDNQYTLEHIVYRKDKKAAGKIRFEKGTFKVSITSVFDNVVREYQTDRAFDQDALKVAVQYLMSYGYL